MHLQDIAKHLSTLSLHCKTHTMQCTKAIGSICAQPINALHSTPSHASSSMDGYTLHCTPSWPKAMHPIPVSGTTVAGDAIRPLKPWHAHEVMTGALLPEGANCVIPYEDCAPSSDYHEITLTTQPSPHQWVRMPGSDFKKGQSIAKKGTMLHYGHIMQCIAQGISQIQVFKPLQIGIIYTGKEIIPPSRIPSHPSQIPNSIASYFSQLMPSCNLRLYKAYYSKDSQKLLTTYLKRLLDDPNIDLILTIGGVSKGKMDLVRPTLGALNCKKVFEKAAIKPGGPVACFQHPEKVVFALPGNPLSSICAFEHIVYPWIRAQRAQPIISPTYAPLPYPILQLEHKTQFLIAHLSPPSTPSIQPNVHIPTEQASYQLSLLSGTHWAIIPSIASSKQTPQMPLKTIALIPMLKPHHQGDSL